MSRPRGGFIGYTPQPAASAANSAAGGIWTLREAESLKRAGTWPIAVPQLPTISGLQLHLDASDASTLYDATTGGSLVAADGGVARWEDKSGSGNHATQATAANRPARKTAIQNGRDVLRFDGTNDVLVTSAISALDSVTTTYFIVAKVDAKPPAASAYIFNNEYTSGPSAFAEVYSGGVYSTAEGGSLFINARQSDGTFVGASGANRPSPTANVAFLLAGRLQSTGVDVYFNGGAAISVSASVVAPSGHIAMQIGDRQGFTLPLDGDICELVAYSAALSDTDRESVENYLMTKWGIS